MNQIIDKLRKERKGAMFIIEGPSGTGKGTIAKRLLDEDKNIIIKPLAKDVVESGVLDECCLLKIEFHKSFARISSVQLLKQIGEVLRIQFTNKPTQFETRWDSVENVLIIKTGEN